MSWAEAERSVSTARLSEAWLLTAIGARAISAQAFCGLTNLSIWPLRLRTPPKAGLQQLARRSGRMLTARRREWHRGADERISFFSGRRARLCGWVDPLFQTRYVVCYFAAVPHSPGCLGAQQIEAALLGFGEDVGMQRDASCVFFKGDRPTCTWNAARFGRLDRCKDDGR